MRARIRNYALLRWFITERRFWLWLAHKFGHVPDHSGIPERRQHGFRIGQFETYGRRVEDQ